MVFKQDRNTDDYGTILKKIQEETIMYIKQNPHPIFLFLPMTYEDGRNVKVIGHMVKVIKSLQDEHDCIDQILVGLDAADTKVKYKEISDIFSNVPKCSVMWNDDPDMLQLYKDMKRHYKALTPGKGRNLWTGLGIRFIAKRTSSLILHDCDILPEHYSKSTILSLVTPIIHPKFEDNDFCKAYYTRLTKNGGKQKLGGRLTRLLISPFIDAIRQNYAQLNQTMSHYADFLQSFRYPLSGEFAMRANIADILPILPNWGLEIGTLNFLFGKRYRIAQVDLGTYDHKHADFSTGNPKEGLNRMTEEVVKTFFRKMFSIADKVVLDETRFDKFKVDYINFARKQVATYRRVSASKDYSYDDSEEMKYINTIKDAIDRSFKSFVKNPGRIQTLPNWDSINPIYKERFANIIQNYDIVPVNSS